MSSYYYSSIPVSPLTFALVHLAPNIRLFKLSLQILSWHNPFDACLALAAWWLFSLFASPALLPLPLLLLLLTNNHPHTQPIPDSALQNTISDLSVIHQLLPALPRLHLKPRPFLALYAPYLLLTYLVPLRLLCASLGTILLTWRAPWSLILRTILMRSASIRWALYRLSGQPLPPKSLSPSTPSTPSSLRFLFTIQENQRWWMGLDWTAALLPAERPSWCSSDPTHAPLAPPNAFTLPDPTTVYLPEEKGSGRIKRTAQWHWEEPEWMLIVKKDGSTAVTRVDNGTQTDPTDDHDEEPFTDADGWVYGDNKWENQSSRGGISKYTRFRRWTRVAVVTEHVQHVEMGEIGIKRPPSLALESPQTRSDSIDSAPLTSPASTLESPLRQRLRMALHKTQGSAQ